MKCDMPQGHPSHCGCVPPTTEYVGARVPSDLPLLPSERRQLENKVKEAIAKYETAYANALRHVTYVINTHEGLTQEQRDSIVHRIWHE